MQKNPNRYFFRILTILFILFVSVYIAIESGYYESQVSKKTNLTQENIERFEEDVSEGKNIDLNNYVEEEVIDYNSTLSKAGMSISRKTEELMTTGFMEIFKFVGNFFS